MEIYQRMEKMIGKTLPLYQSAEGEVSPTLMERVSEAQRFAKMVNSCMIDSSGTNYCISTGNDNTGKKNKKVTPVDLDVHNMIVVLCYF